MRSGLRTAGSWQLAAGGRSFSVARHCRTLTVVGMLAFGVPSPVFAQQAQPSRLAIESVVAVDETIDADAHVVTGVIADALVSVDLGGGVQFLTRPFAQRLANTGEWNRQIWIAALRYERPGTVGLRVDAGLIPSPVGASNLLLRPHLNPTIAQPSSLFTPLPPVVLRGPRSMLLGGLYPLGATVTLSGTHWDARGAIMDTSPMRARRVFADDAPRNPPQFANVVAGAGITPFVGFRLGGSVTRGGWLKAGESPAVTTDRSATVLTLEGELAFGHTKLLGEWVRDAMDTDAGGRVATGWFIQGQQTLAPRWFVAARVERIGSTSVLPIGTLPQHLTGIEETVGFRLTPDFTVRASHRARDTFGAASYGHTAAVSLVWWKRIY